jgi:hypothetical protein
MAEHLMCREVYVVRSTDFLKAAESEIEIWLGLSRLSYYNKKNYLHYEQETLISRREVTW